MDDTLSIHSTGIPPSNLPGTASLCIGVLLPSSSSSPSATNDKYRLVSTPLNGNPTSTVTGSTDTTVTDRNTTTTIPSSSNDPTVSALTVSQDPPIIQIQTKNESMIEIEVDLIYQDNLPLPTTTRTSTTADKVPFEGPKPTPSPSVTDEGDDEEEDNESIEEEDFYEQTMDPLITSVLEGINASVLVSSSTKDGFLPLLGGPTTSSSSVPKNGSNNKFIVNNTCPLRKRKRVIDQDNIYIDMNQVTGCLTYVGYALTNGIQQKQALNHTPNQGRNDSTIGTTENSYSTYPYATNFSASPLITTAQLQISAISIIDPIDDTATSSTNNTNEPLIIDLLQDTSLMAAPGIPFLTALRQQQQLAHQNAYEILIDDEIGPYVRNASLHGPIVSNREMLEILNFITSTYERLIQKLQQSMSSSASSTTATYPSISSTTLPSLIVQFTVTQGSGNSLISARNNTVRSQFIIAGISSVATPYLTQLAQKAANITHILPLPLSLSAGSKLWPLFGTNSSSSSSHGAQTNKDKHKNPTDIFNTGPTSGTFTALADLAAAQTAHPVAALLSECFGLNYLSILLYGIPSTALPSSLPLSSNPSSLSPSTGTALVTVSPSPVTVVPTLPTKDILDFINIFRTCRCFPVTNTANIRMLQRQQRALIRQLRNNSGFLGQVLGGYGPQISLDTEERILTLQDNLLQLTLENETLRSEVDHLNQELNNRPTNQDIQDYTSEIHTLRRNLGAKIEEIRLLREQIKVYQEELSMAPPEVKEMQDSRNRRTLLVSYILAVRRRLALLTPDTKERETMEATAALAVAAPLPSIPSSSSSTALSPTVDSTGTVNNPATTVSSTTIPLPSTTSFDPLTLEDRILQEAKDGLGTSLTIQATNDSALASELVNASTGTFVNYSTLVEKLQNHLQENKTIRNLNTNMRNQLIRARDALLAAKQAREAYQNPFKTTLQGTAGEREATTKAMRILRGHLLRVQDRAETLQVENDRLRTALGESADRIRIVADLASARENTNPDSTSTKDPQGKRKNKNKHDSDSEDTDNTGPLVSNYDIQQSKALQERLMKQLKQSEERTVQLLRENALLSGQTEGLKEQLKHLVTRYESAMGRLRNEVETLRARLLTASNLM